MSKEAGRFSLDRRALARAFDRAGPGYDAAAWLQRRAAAELLERLAFFDREPLSVLDLGAGTCHASGVLAQRYPRAQVLAIDLSSGMLRAAARHRWRRRPYERLCADACALPLADASVGLIYSNLMIQWCDRPARLFAEAARVLTPGGLMVFSSLGPESLAELLEAWTHADAGTHVSEFPDMAGLGAALMQAGFVEPVLDVEPLQQHYPDALALMRELKRLGAHNATSERARGLTGRTRWRAMTAAYERHRTPGGLPASWQLLYAAAFNGPRDRERHGAREASGEFVVPLDSLRSRS